jgi:hypothetical protein
LCRLCCGFWLGGSGCRAACKVRASWGWLLESLFGGYGVISEVFGVKDRDYVWDQGRGSRFCLRARKMIEILFESKAQSLDCGRCCRITTYTGCQTTSYTKYADQASHTYLFKNPSLLVHQPHKPCTRPASLPHNGNPPNIHYGNEAQRAGRLLWYATRTREAHVGHQGFSSRSKLTQGLMLCMILERQNDVDGSLEQMTPPKENDQCLRSPQDGFTRIGFD